MKISCNTYTIHINDWDAIVSYVEKGDYSSILVIVDENTSEHCLPMLAGQLTQKFDIIEIESGEGNKDIETCQGIWQTMIDFGADRHSLCINLGGGVIGDMGGFVASTFMRGMDFVQVPTTLLSQVDASIGGKLGIDFMGLKNLIGLIKNPGAVFIFTEFLATLPENQVRSGYAEVIKHGLICDSDIYNTTSQSSDLTDRNWDTIVYESVLIKKEVTEQDPEERGQRKILNFGHTIGHGVESYNLDGENHLLHGEAIAIGMIVEAHLSYQHGFLSKAECTEIKYRMLRIYGHHPYCIPPLEELFDLMKKDKKNKGGQIMFSLLNGIGNAVFNKSCTQEMIDKSVAFYVA